MTRDELEAQILLGEDSRRQFKVDVAHVDSLAADLVAFSNGSGGVLVIGVADDGTMPGLAAADVRRVNQHIANAASQNMRSPVSPTTENVCLDDGRIVIVVTVAAGLDKPYFDRHGVIWVKAGSDRRRIQSKEELRRLFQMTDQFHADELPTKAGVEALDHLLLREFFRDVYKRDYPSSTAELLRLLQNLNLATDNGDLNLAGLLLFAQEPERYKPQFVIKAICYPGNDIHGSKYLDSEDFVGPLGRLFDSAMAFVLRNLRKVQAGRGVNAPGLPEIPPVVFEELLVNALVHRDYLISAPIRLFVFDDRIEIVSPGHLPDHLTVEKIRAGNSNIRNPILVSHVAKGILPYRGLGSGIQRVLEEWPATAFRDDRDGCLFTATVQRPVQPGREPGIARQSPVEQVAGQVTRQVAGQVTRQVTDEVVRLLAAFRGDMTRSDLQGVLNLHARENFESRYLKPALAAGLIEMTIPGKPTSRLQTYRLTEKGRRILAEVVGEL
jgi:ATP-dependent DNA helicase RecG